MEPITSLDRTILELSQHELSLIFRTGELYDLKINRGKPKRIITHLAQYDGLPVTINDDNYIIERIFPIAENKTDEITVYYNIGTLESYRNKYNF